MSRVLILSCSPRAGGNSDAAADIIDATLTEAGANVLSLRLREHPVRPCTGCGWCADRPGRCLLDGKGDAASFLFAKIARASVLVLTAPVYFYGPPARFKALIDRCQTLWETGGKRAERPAFVVLAGARARGEKLFEASLLILRCVLPVLGFALRPPLLLRALDGPDALRADLRARAEVAAFAAAAIPEAPAGGEGWDT